MSVWLDFLLRYADIEKPPKLSDTYSSVNRINSRGDQFEYFIKDLLTGTLNSNANSASEKEAQYMDDLSWTGFS